MKRLLDINTWIALTIDSHSHHRAARQWYESTPLNEGDLVLCHVTEIGVCRLLTQSAMMKQCGSVPVTNVQASRFLESLRRDSGVSRESETEETKGLWLRLAALETASPNVWLDAYLAAFAITLDAELVTFDRGFTAYLSSGLALQLLKP